MGNGKPKKEDWGSLHEAYTEAQFRYYLGNEEPFFHIRIDPRRVMEQLYAEAGKDWAYGDEARLYVERARAVFEPTLSGDGVTLAIEPYGGPKTGGPVPDQQYVLGLVGLAIAGMTTIVAIADFAGLVKRFTKRAKEVTANEVIVSEGLAIVLAADAIYVATGESDLTFAFATPMTRYTPDLGEWDSNFDGYLVGFRDRDSVRLAHVNEYGIVTLVDGSVPVEWKVTH